MSETKEKIMNWLKMQNSSPEEVRKALTRACLFIFVVGTPMMLWSYSKGDWLWTAFFLGFLLSPVYLAYKYVKLARVLRKKQLEEAEKRIFEELPKTSSPACRLLSIEGKTAARVVGWNDRKSTFRRSLKNIYREDEVPKSAISVSLVVFDEKGKPCNIMQEKRNSLDQYYVVP